MLCDFGLARIQEETPSGLTTTSQTVGTIRYTSPEVVNEEGLVHTLSTDIWSWGCLLLVVRTKST